MSAAVSGREPARDGADEILIGVSSCLLGEQVRFDGGHKRDRFLTDTLARFVRFVPVCPELEIGLGTPRETLRLVRDGERVRLVANKSGADHTRAMERWAKARLSELRALALDGYVLKKDSPSCGMERVRVYGRADGPPDRSGRGLYAEALMAAEPLLPVEEEGRLRDPRLRENFLERVFAHRRLRQRFAGRWALADLVGFHTAEKLLLMAHDVPSYRELGRLVAGAKARPRAELLRRYSELFMRGLGRIATPAKNANVLHHVAGYFKRDLGSADRRELADLIDDYRRGLVPLVAPVTLCRHYVRALGVDYLAGQTYLEPHPKELMLRNHV